MIFDVDAVKQLIRHYNGFYLVKSSCVGNTLLYKSDEHCCSVKIDCDSGDVTVILDEDHRGRKSITKNSSNYNFIHDILNDPRLLFMEEVVKPRKKNSDLSSNEEPLTFSISAFKNPSKPTQKKQALFPIKPSLPQRGMGLDLGSDLGCIGPPVPTLGPRHEPTRMEKLRAAEAEKLRNKNKEDSDDHASGSSSSPTKSSPLHQDLLAMDYLYRTKTKNELNFMKRQIEKDYDNTEKKAKLSHKQNIEKYNTYLAAIPEQNELRRINWHKH